jgi:hypothetical protein
MLGGNPSQEYIDSSQIKSLGSVEMLQQHLLDLQRRNHPQSIGSQPIERPNSERDCLGASAA